MFDNIGVPYETRTSVDAVKGRCPGPLDERDRAPQQGRRWVADAPAQVKPKGQAKGSGQSGDGDDETGVFRAVPRLDPEIAGDVQSHPLTAQQRLA